MVKDEFRQTVGFDLDKFPALVSQCELHQPQLPIESRIYLAQLPGKAFNDDSELFEAEIVVGKTCHQPRPHHVIRFMVARILLPDRVQFCLSQSCSIKEILRLVHFIAQIPFHFVVIKFLDIHLADVMREIIQALVALAVANGITIWKTSCNRSSLISARTRMRRQMAGLDHFTVIFN